MQSIPITQPSTTLTPETKATLLDILTELPEQITPDQRRGICQLVHQNLIRRFDGSWTKAHPIVMAEWLKETWVHWPKYSGHNLYPVPENFLTLDPTLTAEDMFYQTEFLWKGSYGKLRYELRYELLVQRIADDIATRNQHQQGDINESNS